MCLRIRRFTFVMLSLCTSCKISAVLPSLHLIQKQLYAWKLFSDETKKLFRPLGLDIDSVDLIENWICLNQCKGLLNGKGISWTRKLLVYMYTNTIHFY